MKITIIIPTWNREKFLENLVTRIIKLIECNKNNNPNIKLSVFNNGSTAGTMNFLNSLQELKKHEFNFEVLNSSFHSDGGFSIYQAILYSSLGLDWVWLHCDDDQISDSITPDRFHDVLLHASDVKAKIIVACGLDSMNSSFAETNTLELGEACNKYGFINTLGWISGLIFQPSEVLKNYFSPLNKFYWQSPYTHSFILFKTYFNENALLWNSNVINPQITRKQSEIDQRWNSENVLERFSYVLPSFLDLLEEGKNFQPAENFFRMHTWSYIAYIINQIFRYALNNSRHPKHNELMKWLSKRMPFITKTNSGDEFKNNINAIRSVLERQSDPPLPKLISLQFPPHLMV